MEASRRGTRRAQSRFPGGRRAFVHSRLDPAGALAPSMARLRLADRENARQTPPTYPCQGAATLMLCINVSNAAAALVMVASGPVILTKIFPSGPPSITMVCIMYPGRGPDA